MTAMMKVRAVLAVAVVVVVALVASAAAAPSFVTQQRWTSPLGDTGGFDTVAVPVSGQGPQVYVGSTSATAPHVLAVNDTGSLGIGGEFVMPAGARAQMSFSAFGYVYVFASNSVVYALDADGLALRATTSFSFKPSASPYGSYHLDLGADPSSTHLYFTCYRGLTHATLNPNGTISVVEVAAIVTPTGGYASALAVTRAAGRTLVVAAAVVSSNGYVFTMTENPLALSGRSVSIASYYPGDIFSYDGQPDAVHIMDTTKFITVSLSQMAVTATTAMRGMMTAGACKDTTAGVAFVATTGVNRQNARCWRAWSFANGIAGPTSFGNLTSDWAASNDRHACAVVPGTQRVFLAHGTNTWPIVSTVVQAVWSL